MIGQQSPETSDPELLAKRAIDEAVATLRTLAQEQARQAAQPAAAPQDTTPRGDASDREDFVERPLEARIQEGFHRLGIVFAVPLAIAAGGTALLSALEPGGVRSGAEIALVLLAGGCATYLFCRALGWVAFGFLGLPRAGDGEQTAEPRGIGGWLWLPILTIVALIVFALGQIPRALALADTGLQNQTSASLFLVGATALSYAVTAAWIYELVLIWRRRARARRLYVAISLTSLTLAAAVYLVRILYFGMPPENLLQTAAQELSHAIWIPYMLVSRRVRNTFVNRR